VQSRNKPKAGCQRDPKRFYYVTVRDCVSSINKHPIVTHFRRITYAACKRARAGQLAKYDKWGER